jgi:hypothetical protein
MADREAYDWMVKDGRLDPKVKPPTDENFALAADPVKNKEAVAAWQASKGATPAAPLGKPEEVASMPDPVKQPPKPSEDTSWKTVTPDLPKPGVALPEPGAPIEPTDTPGQKAVKTETALPTGVTPNTYKPSKKEPDFWEQVLSVAGQAGKSIISVLADFTAGYAGKETPSEIRRVREHEILMEGKKHVNTVELANIQNKSAEGIAARQNALQRELTDTQQRYTAIQNKLQRDLTAALAKETNELTRQSILQTYQLQKDENQRRFEVEMLTLKWSHTQAVSGATGDAANLDDAIGM